MKRGRLNRPLSAEFGVMVQLMNFRSMKYSIFTAPPHKWLLFALFWEIVLVIVLIQIPSVRESFGIVMPTMRDIALFAGMGLNVFASMEVIKVVLRRKVATS